MTHSISILIPTYNCCCTSLVESLHRQLTSLDDTQYEIIVADDGSSDTQSVEQNKSISNINNCRYIICQQNVGRSAIRNFLANTAQYGWLLFIDSDMSVIDDNYINNYLCAQNYQVVYGSYAVKGDKERLKTNLRYIYEKHYEAGNTAAERNKHPYKNFHTSNFMVSRDVMISHPFDERFTRYGYEDVLWGKTLCDDCIKILHIDNPVAFDKYEDNADFLSKTIEGIYTLYDFRTELHDYSSMITLWEKLYRLHLTPMLSLIHKLLHRYIKDNLKGNKPSLFMFKVYKLLVYNYLTIHS